MKKVKDCLVELHNKRLELEKISRAILEQKANDTDRILRAYKDSLIDSLEGFDVQDHGRYLLVKVEGRSDVIVTPYMDNRVWLGTEEKSHDVVCTLNSFPTQFANFIS